ncbi:hypothetical protein BOTBODRAFT_27050 [Botryobasidium botryosum FD-172 SS1]|uniref:PNPLA domain-containing protein n=1 Tax=Botryobasidium botryosum (strain FD-172 SS1) TaxID=930990 RepID=A0A067NB70_BOTB1|nr:hypothetical protein BOTBODRAFT_27050 [Botryobasidium botryosum FD-172 SS1]
MASSAASDADDLLYADYVNEEHILAFARALESDDTEHDGSSAVSPVPGSPTSGRSSLGRVRRVSALSDFAPIHQKVKRRRRSYSPGGQGGLYTLLRWPLLILLFVLIFAEFGLYVLIRQIVNAFEWLVAWRGRKGALRAKLRSATTYAEWKEAARVLDQYLGFDEWKKEDEDPYFDWTLVKKVRRSLRSLRAKDDARGVLGVLEVCIRANFAGTESPRLYSESYLGTKDLIESYVTEVESALAYIRESPKLSVEEKRRFFRSANRNLGSSALCLSGGATFGYYHFGIVKAFLEADLLPRVIAGTSAGGLVAALTCTRTDDELRKLLVPALADRITACEESFSVWIQRLRKTGARFDTVKWARKSSFFTRGSLTFREAYELTGRVLNISVIPFDRHSPTKLLNYLTAPDCVIWSAILASAAVPGIMNPVVLMQKTKSGALIPWNWGSRFKDGSLRVDIPLQSLNLLFNVNHPIVSQVNPHVHLFFFAPRGSAGKPVAHRRGKGWRGGFLLSASEQFLKLELTKNFKVIRDLELLPQLLGQDWSSVFLQRFDGSVTIWPRTRVMDWLRLLSDPDQKELARMLHVGQIAAWPKLHMVENRFRLEQQILQGRIAVRSAGRSRSKERGPALGLDIPPPTSLAGSSRDRADSAVPWPSLVREQIAVESENERGFESGAKRFFKRGHLLHPDDADKSNHESGADDIPADLGYSEDPLSSPLRRRRWASTLLHGDGDFRDESPARRDDGRIKGMSSSAPAITSRRMLSPDQFEEPSGRPLPDPNAVLGRRQSARTQSFIERFRSSSFASLPASIYNFARSPPQTPHGSSGKEKEARGRDGEMEQWSSESSSEDEFSWSGLGTSLTPKAQPLPEVQMPEDGTEVGGVDETLRHELLNGGDEDLPAGEE